ncbi:MAG: diaminopropionate ammonia-lyase [Alsobacter sp.]
MTIETFPARHVANRLSRRGQPYGPAEASVLDRTAAARAGAEIMSWPGYRPTPLVSLPGLAGALGVGSVLYKDEGQRFGLTSFKALGGAYAVLRFLQKHLEEQGISASAADLLAGAHRDKTAGAVVTTATDGNHGRSVAWGARMFGCRAVVFIHENVSHEREQAIAAFGAEMRRVPGGYDDSVRAAAQAAETEGWILVADTSSEGGDEAPRLVMQGYMLIGSEILDSCGPAPTHLFVQAGVGGLAAALAAFFWESLGALRPRVVVVEPILADCIFRAAQAGRVVAMEGPTDTFMACLAAGEASPLAWTILEGGMDDVLALPDEAAMAAMRLLADGVAGDPALVAGESGAAAVAGLIAAANDPALRRALDLGLEARIVVIGSEGATDPATYERVTGRSAEAVAAFGPAA